jgi:hypothetical protein
LWSSLSSSGLPWPRPESSGERNAPPLRLNYCFQPKLLLVTSLPASIPASVLSTAERLLSRHFGGRIRIIATEPTPYTSDRALVARLLLDGAGPPGAILKIAVEPAGPSSLQRDVSTTPGANARYANERAGVAFLASLGLQPPVAPLLYGTDELQRLILLEDLGEGLSLAEALTGTDPALAEVALEAYMRALGRIHAASVAETDAYEGLIDSIQPRRRSLEDWRTRVRREIERFADTFAELEFEWTPPLVDDVQQVAAALLAPGPFLAYAHGDPCPGNDRLFVDPTTTSASEPRLLFFDFELGGLRHVLTDAMYPRVGFTSCGFCASLPEDVLRRAEGAYRVELMRGAPEAEDESLFRRAAAEACAFWLLAGANRLMPRALRFEDRWGLATYRQRILHLLAACSEATLRARHLPALGAFASITLEKLRAKWPEVQEIGVFPAFQGQA